MDIMRRKDQQKPCYCQSVITCCMQTILQLNLTQHASRGYKPQVMMSDNELWSLTVANTTQSLAI